MISQSGKNVQQLAILDWDSLVLLRSDTPPIPSPAPCKTINTTINTTAHPWHGGTNSMWHSSHINPAPPYPRRQERADLCVCVWLCDCATVSLDRGASSAICSAGGKFSDPMNSTKCSHPEVLVESCFWSGSAHFTAAPTGARQLPCKPRPVSLSFFPLPSPPGGLTSSFQTKILVMEQLSRCRHFLLRRLFFSLLSLTAITAAGRNRLITCEHCNSEGGLIHRCCIFAGVDVEKERCHDFTPARQAAEWREK